MPSKRRRKRCVSSRRTAKQKYHPVIPRPSPAKIVARTAFANHGLPFFSPQLFTHVAIATVVVAFFLGFPCASFPDPVTTRAPSQAFSSVSQLAPIHREKSAFFL